MPDKIGHYTIVSQLGRGGMGVVYKGHEESLNRYVAIKVLGEHLSEDEGFLTRFVREARAAAGLSHPNIVQIFFIGEDAGTHYFVMEFVSGRSLHSMIKEEGRIDNPRAAQLMLQAAHGLGAAHDQGIIHRDIKPANLMLDPRGMVKIADFGLALPAESQTRLTATGMLMGTPGYLAPEQCRNEQADHRTDIYALGVTFYELLTGTQPFKADSPLALLKQILDEDPPDIGALNPTVDDETKRILGKMIEKDRDLRYQDCHELAADLEEYIHSKGVRSVTQGLTMPDGAAGPARDPLLKAHADRTPVPGRPKEVTPALGSSDAPTAATPVPGHSAAPTAVTPSAGTSESPTAVTASGASSDAPTTVTPAPGTPPPPPPAAVADTIPSPPPGAPAPVVAAVATPPKKSRGMLIFAILAFFAVGSIGAAVVVYKIAKNRGLIGENKAASVAGLEGGAEATDATGAPTDTSAATMPDKGDGAAGSNDGTTPVDGMTPADGGGMTPVAAGREPEATKPSGGTTAASTAPASKGQNAPAKTPVPPPPPPLSGTLLAVSGDPALTQYVSEIMMTELSAVGVQAEDASVLPGWDDLMRQDPKTAYLVDQVENAGFATLILVRVDSTGQRQLKYMGRYETAYAARVTMQKYDIASGRPVGQRESSSIEYTQLNAQREAESKIGPAARRFVGGL